MQHTSIHRENEGKWHALRLAELPHVLSAESLDLLLLAGIYFKIKLSRRHINVDVLLHSDTCDLIRALQPVPIIWKFGLSDLVLHQGIGRVCVCACIIPLCGRAV